MRLGAFLVFLAVSACQGTEFGFHSDEIVDSILNADEHKLAEVEVPALPFHFRVPLDDTFGDVPLAFIDLSDPAAGEEAEKKQEKKKQDSAPVQCETICKRMDDGEAAESLVNAAMAKGDNAEAESTGTRQPQPEDPQAGSSEEEMDTNPPATALLEEGNREGFVSLAELGRTICKMKGGKWDHSGGECAPFMRSTEGKGVANEGKNLFDECKKDFGASYVPCSPYQALALAHMYDVPDHMYYWLWPGGRHDQANTAVFKQDIGHNPSSGLDTCPEDQHVGFFHNWNEAHVDSWGCLHKTQKIPVLCCRQN